MGPLGPSLFVRVRQGLSGSGSKVSNPQCFRIQRDTGGGVGAAVGGAEQHFSFIMEDTMDFKEENGDFDKLGTWSEEQNLAAINNVL